MKKINFKDKHIRLGGYSTLITMVLIAILLVVNVLFSSLELKIDLTEEKFYSLSEKTDSIVSKLEDSIAIYVLEETGKENKDFQEILGKYEKINSNVSVLYKDPVLYPGFASKYMDTTDNETTLPSGSIIVENTVTNKFKVIPSHDLYNYSYNSSYQPQIQSIAIEEKITSAIDYVTNAIERKVYVTSGHGEFPIPNSLTSQLETENFIIEDLNLLTQDIPHSPYNTLLIYSPHLDFAEGEKDKIIDFLESGGKAMIFTDSNMPELPNFSEILSLYGLEAQTGIVVEGSQNHMVSPYPTFILPEIHSHQITDAIKSKNLPIIAPLASSLKVTEDKRKSVTHTPLLVTSNDAWLKVNIGAETIEKEASDLSGPFNIAYAVEDLNTLDMSNTITTKLFVMSNTIFLDDTQLNISATGNLDLVMNGLLWLQDKEESLYIGPKAFTNYTLPPVNASTLLIFAGVSMVVLPLIAIITGIVIWLRRRHL